MAPAHSLPNPPRARALRPLPWRLPAAAALAVAGVLAPAVAAPPPRVTAPPPQVTAPPPRVAAPPPQVEAAGAGGQDLQAFAARTTVHVTANGWTFILVQRPVAPVFSFCTIAGVGSVQEVPGITGLAHMFEHMAFKGTETIGTRDPAGEKRAMDALEEAYQAYQRARLAPRAQAPGAQGPAAAPSPASPAPETARAQAPEEASPQAPEGAPSDNAEVARLYARFKHLEAEAERFVVKGELDQILSEAGAVGVNATTGADETRYFYSLPANQVELFAAIEADRFWHPVFREFYEERDVVQEERRMRIDGEPLGRLSELLVETAFSAHPYHQPTIGYMSDLQSITRTDAEAFFRSHYVPASMVTAIVGDIHPQTLIPLLDERFGRIPARPPAPPLRTVEPPQAAAKRVTLVDPAQPQVLISYHRPAITHPDDAVFEAIDDVLTGGRTSRLYRALVRDQKLAVEVESFSGLPGEKYPNLWTVLAAPAIGVSGERVLAAIDAELERLAREDVSDAELAKFRARARAALVRSLGSNQGLATALAHYQMLHGDWRELFREIDRFDRVTKADVRRVAAAALTPANRTVALLVTQTAPAAAPAAMPAPSRPPGSRRDR